MYKKNNSNKSKYSLNVIIADTILKTFKKLPDSGNEINYINLSSSFAVNFVMEYEKIDLIIISKSISNLDLIKKKASRKNIKLLVIGVNISDPLDIKELKKLLNKEIKSKRKKIENKKFKVSEIFNLKNFKTKKTLPVKKEKQKKVNAEPKIEKIKIDKPKDKSLYYKTIKQKIIVFSRTKGGVGSSVLSIYLSNILKELKILLIDLNFSDGGGDISFYLNLPKVPNIVNFTSNYSFQNFKDALIKFKTFDIMQAPPTLNLSESIELQDIYALVDFAKKRYDLIIFDLPNILDELTTGVIDLADIMVMVSDGTFGSLSRLEKLNNQFSYNDLNKLLVLNKQKEKIQNVSNELINFLKPGEIICLREIEYLKSKSDFSSENFKNLKNFNAFKSKIINLLTSAGEMLNEKL